MAATSNRTRDIESLLSQSVKGAQVMLNADICRFFGCSERSAIAMMRGVPYIRRGRNKLYLVHDVARMMAQREERTA